MDAGQLSLDSAIMSRRVSPSTKHNRPYVDTSKDAQDKITTVSVAQHGGQESEQTKKRKNVFERTLWTFIMIGGFLSTLYLSSFQSEYI